MESKRVGFKHSIAMKLLKIVFGIYFVITVVVTCTQLVIEYYHVKDELLEELKGLSKTFEPGLGSAIWTYNDAGLVSTIFGMQKIDSVVGVKIENEEREYLDALGYVLNDQKEVRFFDTQGEKPDQPIISRIFSYEFSIHHIDEGVDRLVGYGTLYSAASAIVKKLQYGFMLIIINSVIKTAALWIIFLYFTRKIVGFPLWLLTTATEELNPDNPNSSDSEEKTMKYLGLTKQNDEIGTLSRSFSIMRQSIIQKINNLIDLNHMIESMVKIKDSRRLYQYVEKTLESRFDFSASYFYLRNEEDRFDLVSSHGNHQEVSHSIMDRSFVIGDKGLGKFVQSDIVYQQHLSSSFPYSIVCIPCFNEERIQGVILLGGERKPFQLNQENKLFLEAISRITIVALNDINHLQVIKDQNQTLEEKIKERTIQLEAKTRDIQSILENVPEGILTITQLQTIHPEYSKHLEDILAVHDIGGANAIECLFSNTNLGSDILSRIEASLFSMLGEMEFVFDLNAHTLIREFKKTLPNNKVVTLEALWNPIINEKGLIEKIMVTLRDVTELRKAQAEAQAQQQELSLVGEIISVSQEKFNSFIENSEMMIAENDQLIRQTKKKDEQVLSTLFRNMHTIKGNARQYNFLSLTQFVHDIEQSYVDLRQKENIPWDPDHLLSELNEAKRIVKKYDDINTRKLGRKGPGRRSDADKYFMVLKTKINEYLNELNDLEQANITAQQHDTIIQRMKSSLTLIGTSPLEEVLSGIINSLPTLAKELGKETPRVDINHNGIFLMKQIEHMVKNIFMHLFRNSMDHSIETSEERHIQGKTVEGHIQLDLVHEDKHCTMIYRDDGRGLNLNRIREKALEIGIINTTDQLQPKELGALIFHSGFSTAQQVSEISGRGVGMDAVKKFIEKEEGTIEIKFLDHFTQCTGQHPFEYHITLPHKCFIRSDSEKQQAKISLD